jgi:hypothetical protein
MSTTWERLNVGTLDWKTGRLEGWKNWVTPIIIIKKKPIEIVFLIGDGEIKTPAGLSDGRQASF